ncbi:MAG: cytochrome c [Acidobacteria bacterium]|nr:MAG: cytochrome c [Acidobacteriota bacterium]
MVKLSFFLVGTALLCFIVFGMVSPVASRAESTDAARQDLLKRGAQVYKTRCLLCHTAEGKSPNERMRLSDQVWKHGEKPEQIQKVVAEGVKGTVMVGFKNRLNNDDIKAVSAYVMELSQKAKSE